MTITLPRVPNGLAFSCRERAGRTPSKSERSRARSGQLQCRVRRSGLRRSGCHPHAPTTPARNHAGTTGVRSEPRASGITPCTTGRQSEPRQHHDQAAHNGHSAQRAFVPRLHNGHSAQRAFVPHPAQRAPARRRRHNGRSGSAIRRITSKTGCRPRSPDAERIAVQPPLSGPRQRRELWVVTACRDAKKPRSRAPEGGRLQRRVRRSGRPPSGCRPACADHTCTVPRRHDGRSVGITPASGSRPAQRAFI